MKRQDIVDGARNYVGVRWVHQGRSKAGLDCIGLVCAVATDLGVPFEDKMGYERIPNGHEFLRHLLKYLTVNTTGTTPVGSVGVFRENRFPCHVGIFSNKDSQTSIIHAFLPRHKVVEERFVPTAMNLVMVLDFPGLED